MSYNIAPGVGEDRNISNVTGSAGIGLNPMQQQGMTAGGNPTSGFNLTQPYTSYAGAASPPPVTRPAGQIQFVEN